MKADKYIINLNEAKELQKWALEYSGVGKLIKEFKEYVEGIDVEDGIYLDYSINDEELDGGMDFPDVGVLNIIGVINNKAYFLGELRGYNHESYWLSTCEFDEVDTAKNWIELIKKDFEKLLKKKKKIPKIYSLLKKDSPTIKQNLKSILDKEMEYGTHLFAIEESISHEYLRNNKIKDKEIISFMKNILKNLDKKFDHFNSKFEKYLYINLVDALLMKKITKHELKLCIKYILWAIDNRSWLNDNQAYVKWITYTSGKMEPKESKKYELRIRTFCKRKGVPQEQIEAMLKNDFRHIDIPDRKSTELESQFYALDDNEKINFIISNFRDAPYLGEEYYDELVINGDFDQAEKLCKSLLEIIPEFPPFEVLLGLVYKEKGNKLLAKHHFENALRILNEMPENIMPDKDNMIEQTKILIKEVSE